MRRIVGTGLGAVSPLGGRAGISWTRLLAGQSGIRRLGEEIVGDLPSKIGGVVPSISEAPEGGFPAITEAVRTVDQRGVRRLSIHRGCEMATNRIDEQEVSALALHLLQASLVYVNTRMLQTVHVESAWHGRMAPEDYRGLTPLIYAHVNLCGRFDLDMDNRIDFGKIAA